MDTEQDTMIVDTDTTVMNEIEESIKAFMEIEQTHTEIIQKLERLSSPIDLTELQKMHDAAMQHIKETGTSNFGQLLSA